MSWQFNEPKNVPVFTTKEIIEEGKPILYVSHDEDDGAWLFLSGELINEENARLVGLKEIVEIDPSVLSLANLPLGWRARRKTINEPWRRERKILSSS